MDTASTEGGDDQRNIQQSSHGNSLQSFATRQQLRNSVLGIESGDDDVDELNDDEYADLIDKHKFNVNVNNVVHNIFIDHVDKSSNDSGYHHHHGPDNDDILYHNHDGTDWHYHIIDGTIPYQYGPKYHDHALDGVAEHRSE